MASQNFITERTKRILVIMALIVGAFLVRVSFFNGGIRGSDAYQYSLYAHQMKTGQYRPDQINYHLGFRYIVIMSTALSYSLFGANDLSASLFPLLFSILNIFLVFSIGEKIFDKRIALIGGILLIFYPLDIILSSCLGPDSFVAVLSSLVVLCYLLAGQKEHSPIQSVTLFMLSGFFVGVAISAKETSIFLYGVIILDQIIRKQRISSVLWTSLGLAIPLLGEGIYYYIATGDPLLRINVLDNLKTIIQRDYSESAGNLLYYPKAMFGLNLHGLALFCFTWWFVSAGLFWAMLRKDKRVLFPALWLILPMLGFEFGLQSIKEMTLISKNYTYLALITSPAMLICAYFLTEFTHFFILDEKKKKLLIIISILLIACMNMYGTYRLSLNIRDDAAPYISVANYLKDKPRRTIYIHSSRWSLFLKYFLNYDPRLDFRMIYDVDEDQINKVSEAYMVLHKRYLDADIAGRQFKDLAWYAKYFDSPPSEWIKVISFTGEPRYNSVNMYYVK
jgi:4-amino-4-deoxy-L-arabinose transferase-like glycosyltransferase